MNELDQDISLANALLATALTLNDFDAASEMHGKLAHFYRLKHLAAQEQPDGVVV